MEKLDNKLREIGREMGMRFGGKELSLEFIANSSEYLIKVWSSGSSTCSTDLTCLFNMSLKQ